MRIVVIGAGVIGAAVAAQLSAQGGRVTVLDPLPPGAGTSRSSMAWVNAHAATNGDYFELRRAGMREHAALAAQHPPAAWYRPARTLRWAGSRDGQRALEENVSRLQALEYGARWLTRGKAVDVEPAIAPEAAVEAVAHFPDEALVDPGPLVLELVARAREAGASVQTGNGMQVMGIRSTGNRASGVDLASGDRIVADVVVCCAGWRTPSVAALAGVKIPLVPGGEAGSTAPTMLAHLKPRSGATLGGLVLAPALHARPLPGGLVYTEAMDLNAVDLHTPPERVADLAAELRERAARLIPGVGHGAEVIEGRVCVRPMPLDGYPIVGWSPRGLAGVYTVVTHSGITLGLRLAQLVAEELLHDRDTASLAPFRPARFEPAS